MGVCSSPCLYQLALYHFKKGRVYFRFFYALFLSCQIGVYKRAPGKVMLKQGELYLRIDSTQNITILST